jgi:hypothetical protein
MSIESLEAAFKPDSKIFKVYLVLKDQQWHCRECEYAHVKSSQIAGGSGIQGLQRGTKSRNGMEIQSDNHFCVTCQRQTRQDRWTGNIIEPVPAPSMPQDFALRAVQVLGSRDAVDNTDRPPNQLTVDHKLPMIRWNTDIAAKQSDFSSMTDEDIRNNFQLLKASNGSISHNLLKSRTCERCYRTGVRGTPFGISFFYQGGPKWEPAEKDDPLGCIGCGWYDFAKWREELNLRLSE